MGGFRYLSALAGPAVDQTRNDLQLGASQTVLQGDALISSGGKLIAATAAASPDFVAAEDATSTATSLVFPAVIPVLKGVTVFRQSITPLLEDKACNSNSTATLVLVTSSGSNDDWNDGTVYCPALNEHRVISDSAYSGGVLTLTLIEAFSRALTTGDTIHAVPFSEGNEAVKLNSSTPQRLVSTAKADVTGGKVGIKKVDLKKKEIQVYFVA